MGAFSRERVVPITDQPSLTSNRQSRRPIAPLAPATNILFFMLLISFCVRYRPRSCRRVLVLGGGMGGGPEGAVLLEPLFDRSRETDVVFDLLRAEIFVEEDLFAFEHEEAPELAVGNFAGGLGGGALGLLVFLQAGEVAQGGDGEEEEVVNLGREVLQVSFQVTLLQVADLQWVATGAVLGLIASNSGLSLAPSNRPACGVLTIDTFAACW